MRKAKDKSFFCRLFVFSMLLSVLLVPAPAFASEKAASLSRTKLTLYAGASKTLKVSGTGKEVKWSVSGKKLVKVCCTGTDRRKAVITAGKRTGSCIVKVKTGKKVLKCKVTVREKKEDFDRKKISSGTTDRTESFIADSVSGRKADAAFIQAMTDASVKLLQQTMRVRRSGNVLVSPDSVFTALAMTQSGAGGTALAEMEQSLGGIPWKKYRQYLFTLHRRITGSKQITYQTANSVWYRENKIKLKKAFLQGIVNYFGAEVFAAPFSAGTVSDINNWVYNRTRGKIPSIINSLDPSQKLVLLNAVYMKGDWEEPYSRTVKRKFQGADGKKKKVPTLEGTETIYLNINGADGFIKPYRGGTLAFMALLPPKGTSVSRYINTLTGEEFTAGYQDRMTSGVDVRVRLPEFSGDCFVSLKTPLRKMGIREIFTEKADFSRMTDDPVSVDDILHKTHIEVNRKGTEAAAVTAVIVKATSVLSPEKKIVKKVYLNRPFVYAIIDTRTGIPLFFGAVRNL